MSISSTGLYGSATIVNSDVFTDVENLKETVTTSSTTYLQTTVTLRNGYRINRPEPIVLVHFGPYALFLHFGDHEHF